MVFASHGALLWIQEQGFRFCLAWMIFHMKVFGAARFILHMLVICAGNNPSKAKLRGVAKWLRSASQYNLRSVIATLSQRLATHFKAW